MSAAKKTQPTEAKRKPRKPTDTSPLYLAGAGGVRHYTVTLSEGGFLGYVNYEVRRGTNDPTGERIQAGAISRLNYRSDRDLRLDLARICRAAIAKAEGR